MESLVISASWRSDRFAFLRVLRMKAPSASFCMSHGSVTVAPVAWAEPCSALAQRLLSMLRIVSKRGGPGCPARRVQCHFLAVLAFLAVPDLLVVPACLAAPVCLAALAFVAVPDPLAALACAVVPGFAVVVPVFLAALAFVPVLAFVAVLAFAAVPGFAAVLRPAGLRSGRVTDTPARASSGAIASRACSVNFFWAASSCSDDFRWAASSCPAKSCAFATSSSGLGSLAAQDGRSDRCGAMD